MVANAEFLKEDAALARTAADAGCPLQPLGAVEAVNEQQKHVLVEKIVQRFGSDLAGKTIALWGLAYKPNNDDMREARSRTIVAEWKESRTPNFEAIKAALRSPVVFDGRNLYEPAPMAGLGIEYYCIRRAAGMSLPAQV